MKASSGINFEEFFRFLSSITASRIRVLQTLLPKELVTTQLNLPPCLQNQSYGTTDQCIVNATRYNYNTVDLCCFDLHKVKDVLKDFQPNCDLDPEVKKQATCLAVYICKILQTI